MAIPVAARALGPARFGLLGLAWATVEYLGFFDMGLSRATVRFVADSLARAARDVRQIVAVSLTFQLGAGLLAGLAVWVLAPVALGLLSIPADLRPEANAMFRVVAVNVALVLAMNGLRGVLEGAQRFDLAVALRIPASAAATVIPAVGAVFGATLPQILWLVFAARLVVVAALFAAVPRAIPTFRWEAPREWVRLRQLLGYSGWLAVSGFANALLVNFDRFALAAIAGVAAVGFYTAPYEGATRLLLVSASMFAALFPALAATEALADRARTTRLLESALRQSALVLAPLVAVLVVFAPGILRLWVGSAFADEAGLALRILAIGVLFNALAHVPSVFLYAASRPDLPARLHLAELVFHVPLTLLLIQRFGITGAAIAWTLRVAVDATGLALFTRHLGGWQIGTSGRSLWLRAFAVVAMFVLVLLIAAAVADASLPIASVLVAVAAVGAVWVAWSTALGPQERAAWLGMLWRRPGAGGTDLPRPSR